MKSNSPSQHARIKKDSKTETRSRARSEKPRKKDAALKKAKKAKTASKQRSTGNSSRQRLKPWKPISIKWELVFRDATELHPLKLLKYPYVSVDLSAGQARWGKIDKKINLYIAEIRVQRRHLFSKSFGPLGLHKISFPALRIVSPIQEYFKRQYYERREERLSQ